MFKVPESKAIPEMENNVLSYWKENRIFEESVNSKSDNNLYVFYDGPPFISGLPHYGHLLGSVAKDIIPRYWSMKGKKVERVWGWDAHGLTVENKVQKTLGITNRRDIESFGLEKFTQECYAYTSKVSAEWEWYIDRIARWVDMKNAYKTTDRNYMESVMWVFKQLYEKGLIYEGVRTSLFCTTCGTPVSNFEIAMDNTYKDVEDPSIIVKFKLTDFETPNTFILAWTTTPWTIPSNRGLVLDENEAYCLINLEGKDEHYIVAKKRVAFVFGGDNYSVVKEFLGKTLLGLSYLPPYNIFDKTDKDYYVYAFEGMVTMEEGTGIVHSAPGFGEVDTQMGYHYGLRIMMTIDDEGHFLPGETEKNPFEKMFYKKADRYIREDLTNRGFLFKDDRITHRFPYHDRCDTLLIQKAQNSWFIDVQKLKPALLDANQNINWIPDHLKEGRFKHVIETSPDWCISRARFWATPMPVWRAEDGDTIVIGSISELEELSGTKVSDLHRPYIDEIKINKNGKEYKRIPEVLDSWFEAGSMPYGQIHYPFENKQKFEKSFPGDYIVEYIAQVRAWFNVMHRLSVALFGTNSFKNVVTTGVMAGNDGRKMSKTYQNYTDPKDVLETIGGDALRLYLMNSPLMVGENANFDDIELRNKSRNVLNPLWNSLKFFLIYAELYNYQPAYSGIPNTSSVLDKWIITRLHQTIRDFTENIEKYYVPQAVLPVEKFIDDLSRWYVRRSREVLSSGNIETLNVFHYVLSEFCKVAAPVIPFMSEAMYLQFPSNKFRSVHLEAYPQFDSELIEGNEALLKNMDVARKIVSAALSVRVSHKIAVRQPLGKLFINSEFALPNDYLDIVKEETNIKEIIAVEDITSQVGCQLDLDKTVAVDVTLSKDLIYEGQARDFIRTVQDLRKKEKLNVNDKISVVYKSDEINPEMLVAHEKSIMEKVYAESLIPGDTFKITFISK